ncbi:hypothetical protein EN871_07775 [bacterium M00.F.Ca.ET.228.01.1.1]|uniref:phage tail tip lysozyme n=1 Tax=Paraburkholderia phenoliruptrix TaxID=252970 RepID=UPI0010928A54|nr:phage tail tip lysozyme [Paraburkholderia phenoliruptrix]TGP46330.1 hypothetical protein EN871_07775 [bacterium M00.F.Ca.ET.228.01.1.1]TGS03756.1 hypothetical protein EN834_05210 [bacterium M00.F.Ca.ET.191.01.1.1]TGU07624.1 hypothetical protein EN798_11850 [bacterium M00.F.Ca.ET.155.01.1.1]MBW0446253.1 hypothetical protein [Paraburkholderia phenoliruptrix]MBW9096676.1 hypothetical protein [Paraburkholderia phenoliruptrix]
MIDAAELKRLDQLIHQFGPSGSGSGSASDEDIAREIEQILAELFSDGGSSSSGMPSMPSLPAMPAMSSSAGRASSAGYRSTASTAGVPAGDGSGQSASASTPEAKKTAQYFMTNLQRDFGLTRNQAAGIVANLWHESGGMNPGINQGGAIGAPNSNLQSGYGIAQWTGSRKQDYLDYCSANHLDPSSEQANYGFLKHELQTSQSGAIDAIRNTQSAQDATVVFCNTFERPGDPQMSSRLADLQYVLTA